MFFTTQLYWDYFISHELRIPINQPGFNGMSFQGLVHVAQVVFESGVIDVRKGLMRMIISMRSETSYRLLFISMNISVKPYETNVDKQTQLMDVFFVTLPETNIAHENPIFPGKSHQNGGFSMAMLVYRRVICLCWHHSQKYESNYPKFGFETPIWGGVPTVPPPPFP